MTKYYDSRLEDGSPLIKRWLADSRLVFRRMLDSEYWFLLIPGDGTLHFHVLPRERQELVIRWLDWNLIHTEEVNHGYSATEMKAILKDRTGIHLSEMQFREAMMHVGYMPEDEQAMEWYFRVDKKSPIFIIQRDGRMGLPLLGTPVENEGGIIPYPNPHGNVKSRLDEGTEADRNATDGAESRTVSEEAGGKQSDGRSADADKNGDAEGCAVPEDNARHTTRGGREAC